MLPVAARETARRLIAREPAVGAAAIGEQAAGELLPDPVATAERAVLRLANTLVGWFGPFGTHALLTRALVRARADHPALATVGVGAPASPKLEGLADSARVHGATPTATAAADLLAAVVDLLGRLLGDDVATALVQQSAPVATVAEPTRATIESTGSTTRMTGNTSGSTPND